MGFRTILGLDLGKFKSASCAVDVATRTQAFETLATTPDTLHDLLAKHAGGADPAGVLLVIETCDSAGWVHDVAVALGVRVTVVNANDERWRWRRVKRKTDRDDALKLARMALIERLPEPAVHVPAERQRRRLMRHRRSVVTHRTRGRNTIRSIYSRQGLPLAKGNKQWTRAGVAQLKADAREIGDCDALDLWRGRLGAELELMKSADEQLTLLDTKLDAPGAADPRVTLQSIKGVGPRLAEAAVLRLDDPRRFKHGEQVASFAGLVPKQLQSGEMCRLGHVTRRGPALLRSPLVEGAWVVWRHNAWAQAFVEGVSRGGRRRRKLAIVALARKLLVILRGMLKSGQPFRAPATTRATAPAPT